MKKVNLKLGLFALSMIAVLTTSQTVSAFSLRDLLFSGNQATESQEEKGEVLSTSTEQPHELEKEKEEELETEEPEKVIIEVVKGDTLDKIAKAHNTTYRRIFDANESIENPDIIKPGQKFRIPSDNEELVSRPLPAPVVQKPSQPIAPTARSIDRTKRNTTPQPQPSSAPAVADGSVWDRLAQCESGGRWNINTGNGYYGGLQFHPRTWQSVGGTGLPHQHSREEQIYRAEILLARSGWGQWPACTKKLGLR